LFKVLVPTARPRLRPWASACWKWMPPSSRESPASSAAALKVDQRSWTVVAGTAPGSTNELPAAKLTVRFTESLPVKDRMTWAAAALKVLCPDT
jgi:hypothetical protein